MQPASSSEEQPAQSNGDHGQQAHEEVNHVNGDVESKEDGSDLDQMFQITVMLPHEPLKMQIMVSNREQIQDVRQSIVETPETFQYSCFHLEHQGAKINDFEELSDVSGVGPGSQLDLVEDPYTEKDARLHLLRIRDIIGASDWRLDSFYGINAGQSVFGSVASDDAGPGTSGSGAESGAHAMSDYDFSQAPKLVDFLPRAEKSPPKTVKNIALSPWNPPPPHLRQRGHLLYIQVTTLEGESFHITSHVTGFYVNRSSSNKFDPSPKESPKSYFAHSLLRLLPLLSPGFPSAFENLIKFNSAFDPLVTFQPTNALPASPWLVPDEQTLITLQQTDLAKAQESYLVAGTESSDTLRDFNEEFQSTRELPRSSVQERVFRERLLSKLFADFTTAAVKGAMLIAKGELAPLNPTEEKDAQIFVHNNIFFSFGADGVGTFASEGANEAARVATGKDVSGVKAVNSLDLQGLATPGTVLIDYLGLRIVAQSIVPGIFKQREEGENQIDYGGVEGRDIIATHPSFTSIFEKLSRALRVKKHPVWDKEKKRHDLEASVETKGLLGTDGRNYVLDLYRITPLDVLFLESHWKYIKDGEKHDTTSYPHRMAVLRLELVEALWKTKMRDYISEQLRLRRSEQNGEASGDGSSKPTQPALTTGESASTSTEPSGSSEQTQRQKQADGHADTVDISNFSYTLNPDVYSYQQPQTEDERAEMDKDEEAVREACRYLVDKVIPTLITDLKEGEVGSPIDGQSLSKLLHRRGINLRYLGLIAELADGQGERLNPLKTLAVQEMVSRACKHFLNTLLREVPFPLVPHCASHFLNCLLGSQFNHQPYVQRDNALWKLYGRDEFSFEKITPSTVQGRIVLEVKRRFRYDLPGNWLESLRSRQILRDISLKMGFQLVAREYQFSKPSENPNSPQNGTNTHDKPSGKKSPRSSNSTIKNKRPGLTFSPDDILNVVPIVRDAAPKSQLAEEALEAGRISILQDQRQLGQDLLLESLSLHEQIYGILHPEVARVYNTTAMMYYQLDEKSAAVDLARKAVIVSERMLGIDSAETILNYLNLGLFEHASGNTQLALVFIRHAFNLWRTVYGDGHPDSVTTMNNVAVMLQSLKKYHDSRIWFEASLKVCESIFGAGSVNSATLAFQLAQALALDSDSKGAVNRMRTAYNVFLSELGPNDRNTKEAESWLEQLTQNAVNIAKQAKDIQARRLKRIGFTPKVTLPARPHPMVGASPNDKANEPFRGPGGENLNQDSRIDSRSIDELMKFIEGTDQKGAGPGKKNISKANPKRRGMRPAAKK